MNYFYNSSKSTYANRGMILESDINITNEYYKNENIALINKKPTPIKVVKTTYDRTKIIEAFFEKPTTLDYSRIYKEKYIEFDAKETNSKTSFSLNNIHKHQLEYIRRLILLKGITFLIIRFISLNKTYILMGKDLISFIDNNTRKSIPISYFTEKGYEIKLKYSPRLDYLEIIDKLLNEKEIWIR